MRRLGDSRRTDLLAFRDAKLPVQLSLLASRVEILSLSTPGEPSYPGLWPSCPLSVLPDSLGEDVA